MKRMFYAEWRDGNEQLRGGLYFSWYQYHRDTFDPMTHDYRLIVFEVHGKTYGERRESLRNTAIDWSNMEHPDMSWNELALVGEWFHKMGKRYGLLTEFRTEGVI